MGKRTGPGLPSATAASSQIDEILENAKTAQRKTTTILVLGLPGSGKTTFLRHLKMIYEPYTETERIQWINVIQGNLTNAFCALLAALANESFYPPPIFAYIQEASSSSQASLLCPTTTRLFANWFSAVNTQLTLTPLMLEARTIHFLTRAPEITQIDYLPSDLDILFSQIESESEPLAEAEIHVPFASTIRPTSLICVCPRQSLISAHKWLPIFAYVRDVVFVVNVLEYDSATNMKMTFDFFDQICHNPAFFKTNIHILMNIPTTFRRKLTLTTTSAPPGSLNTLYPDVPADYDSDEVKVLKSLRDRFLSIARRRKYLTRVYIHAVDLVESQPMRVLMASFMDTFRDSLAWGCYMT
ncbi:guanine nucleotide binding protein, alpha subunit [Favolaschia claudopus]|uniref:Guanine nucleotide binding protein, alpha subunit n=1 Tax=Favolaschia claudopus TaxID=2862362 RepID=A0AAW0E5F2_9AGAR